MKPSKRKSLTNLFSKNRGVPIHVYKEGKEFRCLPSWNEHIPVYDKAWERVGIYVCSGKPTETADMVLADL
jgi:hypothetical protein